MQKSIFFILVIALVIVGAVVVVFLNFFFKPEPVANFNEPIVNLNINKNGNKNINININTTVNSNTNDNLPLKIYHINGAIKRIEEGRIFVDAIVLTGKTLRPDSEGKTEIIEVIIQPTVKITKLTFIAKEGGNSYAPNIEAIKLSDLKIGDKVEVISSSNIKGKDSFTATTIQLTQASIK